MEICIRLGSRLRCGQWRRERSRPEEKNPMSMGNAVTASGGLPVGTLAVRTTDEQLALSPDRPFVLGRASACDLVLDDGRVSRRHLMLEPSPEGWTAIDLSANGTWLGVERIQRLRIREECTLRLG